MSNPPVPPRAVNGKEELEKEKLRAEIRKLHRRFYQDADWWTRSLPIPFGIVTLVATIWFSTLQGQVKGLEKDKADLESEKMKLTKETLSLDGGIALLKAERTALEGEKVGLQNQIAKLNERLATESLRVRLEYVQKSTNERPFMPALPVEATDLIQFVKRDKQHRDRNLATLERAYRSTDKLNERAFFSIVLFEVTRDGKWRDAISAVLFDTLGTQTSIFDPKADTRSMNAMFLIEGYSTNLNEAERLRFSARLLSDVSSSSKREPSITLGAIRIFRRIWDDPNLESIMESAVPNEDLVRLVLAAIQASRNLLLEPHRSSNYQYAALEDLRSLSHEACVVFMAEELSNPSVRRFDRELLSLTLQVLPENLNSTGLVEFSDIPRTVDQREWRDWVKENDKLVALYLEPGLNTLSRQLKEIIYKRARE